MKLGKAWLLASALMGVSAPAQAADTIKWAHWQDKSVLGSTVRDLDVTACTQNCYLAPQYNLSAAVVLGFEANTQYDNALLQRNFIPPDTMGAVGGTQYMATTNGSYGVYDKYTGVRQSLVSDVAFWAAAGQVGVNGDTRIMYNAAAGRWVMVAFGASVADLQIAVSDTDNALGSWQSVKFTGFAGGVADYPTLALDTNAVYIGTNNFTSTFQGTTLNVIPIDSLFSAGAPTLAGMKQFVTPLSAGFAGEQGYAIQGVNSTTAGTTGTAVAASLYVYDTLTFSVNGLTSSSAAGATATPRDYIDEQSVGAYTGAGAARQPAAIAANQRIIDTLDDRISSSVYESRGYLLMVHTVDPLTDVGSYARVRLVVIDKATNAIVDSVDIGQGAYDYYQGSIAANADGQIVVGFNRSGLDTTDGKIRFSARVFSIDAAGQLSVHGNEIMLRESLTNDYHNGSIEGQAKVGRQRWGDYSQISVDPNDSSRFYAIGQFAREYNNAAGGHPGGSGFSRWSTWVSVIDIAGVVPEPETWLMLVLGFGAIGGAIRRQKQAARITFA